MRSNFLINLYCWSLVASSSLPTDSELSNQIVKLNKRPSSPLSNPRKDDAQHNWNFRVMEIITIQTTKQKNAKDYAKRSENGLKWKIWTQLHHNENSSVMQLPSAANQIRVATDTKQAREMKLSCESPEKVRRLGERRKKISYLHLVFTWSDDCPFCVLLSIGICICKWEELLRRHTESSTRHV
jgi:hypothetical protein